jgi:hypothetical protein
MAFRNVPGRTLPVRLTRALRGGAVVASVAALGACDLNVSDPSVVRPEQLEAEASLPTLFGGAIGDFAVAYAGDASAGDEGIILAGGLRADEFLNIDTFTTRQEIDQGNIQEENSSNALVFRALQRARVSTERAAERYAAVNSNDARRSLARSLAGFTYALLGENYCSGIPFTRYNEDGTFAFGAPLTTLQVFDTALQRFTTALTEAQAARDSRAQNLARVGRGRALVNLGRFAEAATAVQDVPLDFSYDLEFSTNTERQGNAVYYLNVINNRFGVADLEGQNGLPFVSAGDPRLPTEDTGDVGLDGETPLIFQLKYPTRTSNIPVATGIEAALIRAEARLQANDAAGFVTQINALRSAAGLDRITQSASAPRRALEDVLFTERAFWLFGTGHRLGDMRRLLRAPYNRTFATVFPTGTYFKGGGNYGNEANLPIPFDERNNPNFKGCQSRTQ